jgi:hypothetical protein
MINLFGLVKFKKINKYIRTINVKFMRGIDKMGIPMINKLYHKTKIINNKTNYLKY